MLTVKRQLYDLCVETLINRIRSAQQAIEDLQNDANEETKSSAGDKYETGRAMMQLEIEKYSQQLAEASKSKQVLGKIDPNVVSKIAQPGSVVKTNNGNYYIAISTGQFLVENENYFTISPASPVGIKLINTKPGDSFSLNNREYKVLDVY
jgi:transcription elongation GreA/GreB family factor